MTEDKKQPKTAKDPNKSSKKEEEKKEKEEEESREEYQEEEFEEEIQLEEEEFDSREEKREETSFQEKDKVKADLIPEKGDEERPSADEKEDWERRLWPEEEKEKKESESPTDFKTEDLEKIVDPAEKEKEEIETFLESIKKEKGGTSESGESAESEEELPPWAANMKQASPPETEGEEFQEEKEKDQPEEESEREGEEKLFESSQKVPGETEDKEAFSSDTGMGVPETVSQKALPFDEEIEEEEERKGIPLESPSPVSFWLKARAFDVVFITSLWLITMWIASRIIKVSLGQLISTSLLPVMGFFVILLSVYFFLFLTFLGRTLGDHLFPQ